ncbi:MAG: outer membrane protein transport protein [Alphaproteobacteria bacterium]
MRNGTARARGLGARLFTTTALTGLAATVIAVALPGDARAAGFALKEQSATAQGNAFAGATAGAEDISYMFFNPAGLIRHEGMQAATVISYISPHAETTDASGGIGGDSSQDGGVEAVVPAFYGMWSASPDLKVGLGINTPFGLKTKYSEGWAGRLYAIEAEMLTVNINPAVAYRINDMISVGAGVQIQYMDVTLSNFDGVGTAEITGDDWAFGFNLGVLVELSPRTRLGASYRSQIDHTLEGEADVPAAGLTDEPINAAFLSPDSASIGLYHDVNDQWAVMAEVGWTRWSTFEELKVVLDSGGTLSTVPEDWDDVWFTALGVTYRPSDQLTLRAGAAFDQSPIPDSTRSPRIPGADRTWLSLGASYAVSPDITIDAGYTHVFVADSDVDIDYQGVQLTASYENSVDIAVLQATFRF